jgi:6-phosphogluconolactonase
MSNDDIKIFKTFDEILFFLKELFREIITDSIAQRGRCTIALSGGSTPRQFYESLSVEKNLPWNKIHFFIVDERFVAEGSDDHNFTMMRRALFDKIGIDSLNLHVVDTAQPTSKTAAEKYNLELQNYFHASTASPFPSFDLILLGIGTDGHTASLFPGSDALKERSKLAIDSKSGFHPHERITLTFPVLENAENLLFLAAGSEKQSILKRIFIENENLPAAMIRLKTGKRLFVFDSAAADDLRKN